MKLNIHLISICLLLALPVLAIAGPPVTKWKVKDPFEQKVFIENKGQFAIPAKNISASDVLFGARVGGLQYYFTKNSIWISHQVAVKRSDAEIAKLKSQAGETNLTKTEEKAIDYAYSEEFYQMNFIGANASVGFTTANEVSNYYVYGTGNGKSVKANAYKKIIYTDFYPGIDMEVYFPEDKQGFEYAFIVHPGADIAQIKIQYPLNEGLNIEDGNVVIKSVYGDFIEHTPIANQAESPKPVACSFTLNEGVVQFKAGNYNRSETLKIDPWVLNPVPAGTFGSTGNVWQDEDSYEVDWDNGSNCYAYGGAFPWDLIKFGPSGTILWTYSTSFTSLSGAQYLGDFAVDRYSKSIYICEGYNTGGAQMVKLYSDGSVNYSYPGNTDLIEMWRISFSRCVPHEAVIGGGSVKAGSWNDAVALDPANNPNDTNLTSLTPVNVLNSGQGFHDVCLLSLDDNPLSKGGPNSYMGFCSNSTGNIMVKTPVSNLTTIDWNKPNPNFSFFVANSVDYGYGNGSDKTPTNGYEGSTYSELDDLYAYNSFTLERWNTTSGKYAFQVINAGHTGDSIWWGGLGSNNCNDVFVGTHSDIQEYDSSLNAVGAPINEGDTVYSVKAGNYNLLYACGADFVSVIQLDIPFCISFTLDTTINNASCTGPGSFVVTPDGGTANYNYILYNSSMTAVIATKTDSPGKVTFANLAPGTYVLDATDSSCLAERIYSTFTIVKDAKFSPGKVTPNPTAICFGSSVILTASLAQSYSWRDSTGKGYPTGLSDSSDVTTVTANPTVTTTYDLIARTPGDCPDTVKAVVNVNPLPQIAVLPDTPSYCTGGSIALTASGALTYTWAPPGGLSATTGSTVTANGAATAIYTVTGTDVNGCVNDTTVTVTVYPYPVVTASPADTICVGKSTILLANGAASYTWVPSTGLSASTGANVTASPAASITYSVTGTTHGCSTTVLDTVTVNPLPTVAITGLNPVYCIDAAAVVLNGGTPAGGTFSGTGVVYGADTTFNPTTAGVGSHLITYTYTSALGCTNTSDTLITVAPLPTLSFLPTNPVVCSGNPVTITVSGAKTYTWAPPTSLSATTGATVIADPTSPIVYTVTGTDSNDCMNDDTVLVNIGVLPDTGFVMNVPSQCNSLSVIFTSTDTVSGTNYLWKFGDGTTSVAKNPSHTFPHGSPHDTVILYITNSVGCEDSTIHVEALTSPAEQAVFPDAFTPNLGTKYIGTIYAQNMTFKPVINCNEASAYLFRIYNRWGQLIFSTNDQTEGWDGTFNAVPEQVDVYVYYMQFTCGTCPTFREGNVTLLR